MVVENVVGPLFVISQESQSHKFTTMTHIGITDMVILQCLNGKGF